MVDWPYQPLDYPAFGLLSSVGSGSTAGDMLASSGNVMSTTGAWPLANLAVYLPILVRQAATVTNMAWFVNTASGNACAGIYDSTLTRVCTTGSTVQATGMQVAAVTPVTLAPGLYYIALVADNTTGTLQRSSNLSGPSLRSCGVAQQATAFVLPTTATFAAMAQTYLPLVLAQTTSVL